MKNKYRILTICGQPLKNVQSAVRAYNMYKHLEKLGCKVTYLDGWRPTFDLNIQNIKNWIKIFFFKRFSKNHSCIFVENVQNHLIIKILRKLKMLIVLDVRDDLNLHAESMGVSVSEKCFLERELAQIVNFEIAKKILVTSQGYIEYYSKKHNGKFDHKFINITNASDHHYFQDTALPQEPRIGILGGANPGQGFDLLLEAAKIVRKEVSDVSVHIGYTYDLETASYVEFFKKHYSEEWMRFHENIFYTKNAPNFYSNLYLSVIPFKNTKSNLLTTSSKLFESMASARPIVVTNVKEHAKIVKGENCGLVCDFTPEDMAEKILILLKDRAIAQKMGENGRKAVEERHNWNIRAKEIVEEVFIRQ